MTSIIAHEPDCPALCHSEFLPTTMVCAYKHHANHCCACRGEAWLRELIEAADDAGRTNGWQHRLDAALQPFREEKQAK
jgi:hypothetical protein